MFVDETSTNLTYCRRYGSAPAAIEPLLPELCATRNRTFWRISSPARGLPGAVRQQEIMAYSSSENKRMTASGKWAINSESGSVLQGPSAPSGAAAGPAGSV